MEGSLNTIERIFPPNGEGHSESGPHIVHCSDENLSYGERSNGVDEDSFGNLAEYISQIIYVVTPQGHGEYFNPYWEAYTGQTREDSLDHKWMGAFHREDLDAFVKRLRRAAEPVGWEIEARLRRASDGNYRRHVCRCSTLANQAGGATKLLIHCTDVEDSKSVELAAKEQGALLGLSLRTHDEEKRKIAHALQDSAGQYLVALQMKLDGMQRSAIGSTGRKNPIIDDCRELVKRCVREIRATSHLLYPALLDDLGLESAVHLHLNGFMERTKVKVESDIEPNLGRLDRDLEVALFRVAQEALATIHAQGAKKELRIKLGAAATSVFVEVAGRGVPESLSGGVLGSPHRPSGAALAMLRQRILEIGGLFEISSLPNGVVIQAVVPRRAVVSQACD
jgi:PAS domain S-box-containing protein